MNENRNSYPMDGDNALLDLLWQAARTQGFSQGRQQGMAPMDLQNLSWQQATSSLSMPGGSIKSPPHFTTAWDSVNHVTILPLTADVDPVDTEPFHAMGE